MSVGGEVIEVIDCEDDSIWVNTYDGHTECAVYIEKTPEAQCVEKGDALWWQGRWCFWTPKSYQKGDKYEIKIPKMSGSGVNKPDEQRTAV